jgi:perosamine synthetase
LRIGRDEILRALLAENIGVGVHFRALPVHRFFRETLGWRPEMVPVASAASDLVFTLPLYPGLSDADQDHVLRALRRILRYYAA